MQTEISCFVSTYRSQLKYIKFIIREEFKKIGNIHFKSENLDVSPLKQRVIKSSGSSFFSRTN